MQNRLVGWWELERQAFRRGIAQKIASMRNWRVGVLYGARITKARHSAGFVFGVARGFRWRRLCPCSSPVLSAPVGGRTALLRLRAAPWGIGTASAWVQHRHP